MGCNGAAGTAQPVATQVAIETLRRGGSAVDAAIAANAALGFLEPTSSGLGGDCYAMIWDPQRARVVSLAGSGESPRALSLATARAHAVGGALPKLGAVTVSVPGALDAWWTLHQRYGRLPWRELFQPAIRLATDGVPVPQIIGYYIYRNLRAFTRPAPASRRPPTRCTPTRRAARRRARAACSATPTSPAPTPRSPRAAATPSMTGRSPTPSSATSIASAAG